MMMLGGVAAMEFFTWVFYPKKERKARINIQRMPLPVEGTTQPRNQHMKI